MPGPLISKLRNRIQEADEEESRGRVLRQSPLVDRDIDLNLDEHRIELMEELDGMAGGCCGAAEAAQAIRQNRREGQMYK